MNKVRKFYIKILLPGWLYIGITIFMGFAAINTGNNLLYLITSLLLGVMGISGFFGKKNINKIDVDLFFPEEMFVGEKIPIRIIVNNKKKYFTSFLIKLYLKNNKSENIIISIIEPNRYVEKIISTSFNKRGYNELPEIIICSNFPFNFFQRGYYLQMERVLVYPKPLKLNIDYEKNNVSSLNSKKIFRGNIFDTSGEFFNIRTYNESDSIKLINWKASAKIDEILVNEFKDDYSNFVVLEFEKFREPNLEKKISIITGWILFFLRNNIKVILKINGKSLKAKYEILKELACYGKSN